MNEENSKQAPQEEPAATSGSGAGVVKEIRKVLTGIESAVGFGPDKKAAHKVDTGDVSTNLAYQRTDLALDRNYLAAERTLMGWVRTALSMISFGFTIGKLGQVMDSVNTKGIFGGSRTLSIESIAYFLVILGTGALLGAALQYRHRVHELYRMGLSRQFSIAFTISLLLAAVGGFAFTALVMAL
jgi:putative membrane protein